MKIIYGNIGILRYKFAYFIAFYYFYTQIPDIATYKRIKSDYIYINDKINYNHYTLYII